MGAVGYLVGFRVHTGVVEVLAGVLLTLLFGIAAGWAMLYVALSTRTAEATQAIGQTLLFVLTFLSSAFVPIDTMPGWLQPVARVNPVTAAVDALRALLVGGSAQGPVLLTLAWVAGILLLFGTLGVLRYRRGS
jgi:ABC transporter DrrB family efflux protein